MGISPQMTGAGRYLRISIVLLRAVAVVLLFTGALSAVDGATDALNGSAAAGKLISSAVFSLVVGVVLLVIPRWTAHSSITAPIPVPSRATALATSAFVAAWVLYLGSLTLRVYRTGEQTRYGVFVLLFGALASLLGTTAWLANPLFFVGSYFYRGLRLVPACVVTCMATLLALSSYTFHEECMDAGCDPVIGHGAGFYAWLLAILLLFLASVVRTVLAARSRSPSASKRA